MPFGISGAATWIVSFCSFFLRFNNVMLLYSIFFFLPICFFDIRRPRSLEIKFACRKIVIEETNVM